MKFAVSYFYHVRNLAPTCLPISINMGEPSWFHEFKDRSHMFKDKRGVWNGAYIDELSSSNLEYVEQKEDPGDFCRECNREKFVGENCPFMNAMLAKLEKLDFSKTISKLEKLAAHFGCNEICFMVYEKPDVVCGERWAMRWWFERHGMELPEFVPPTKKA